MRDAFQWANEDAHRASATFEEIADELIIARKARMKAETAFFDAEIALCEATKKMRQCQENLDLRTTLLLAEREEKMRDQANV